MSSIEKEPIYDVYCISRHQYQRYLNILFFGNVSNVDGVVLGGVVNVVGSNLARGKIFTASIVISLCNIYIYIYIYIRG